jgi:hypothetical protein
MWENSYYIGGSDDGVLATPAGPVGSALCWELIRSQTARRLVGKVNLDVGGSSWWDLRHPVPPKETDYQALMRTLLRQAPGELARRVGVPMCMPRRRATLKDWYPATRLCPTFLGFSAKHRSPTATATCLPASL